MKKFKAVGANIFAGGFTEGVKKHFEVLAHLEHCNYGAATSELNNPGMPIHIGTDNWPTKWNGKNKVDWLYANPPCALFSVAGGKGGDHWRTDPRLQRIKDIFELLDTMKPKVWCWESVCQAWTRGKEFVLELAELAKEKGYATTILLLDAQYHGVPQIRKRFFLVFHKIEIPWEIPNYQKVKTVEQTFKKLKLNKKYSAEEKAKYLKLIKHTKPGMTLQSTWDRRTPEHKRKKNKRGHNIGRPSFLTRRLRNDRPAGTVIGNTLIHPTEDRHCHISELAALCTFPASYKWAGQVGSIPDQIARGVAPNVGEWLAIQVMLGLAENKRAKKQVNYVDLRKDPGIIETLNPVTSIESSCFYYK